jgi:DNA-binding NtrC family response regulator
MAESVLEGKAILIVDDEEDILTVLEDTIEFACPTCTIDKAVNFEKAAELLKSKHYDVVILDIMGVRGFDLLEIAVGRKLNVVMLTAQALSPEALKKSHDMGARAYLPKSKLAEIVPFLEDVLIHEHHTGWTRIMDKLEDYFNNEFPKDWKERAGVTSWW